MADKPTPRAAIRALRSARRKAYYGAQPMRTEKNRKRRMMRHIRRTPADAQAQAQYDKRYGVGAARALGLTRRGIKRAAGLFQHQE